MSVRCGEAKKPKFETCASPQRRRGCRCAGRARGRRPGSPRCRGRTRTGWPTSARCAAARVGEPALVLGIEDAERIPVTRGEVSESAPRDGLARVLAGRHALLHSRRSGPLQRRCICLRHGHIMAPAASRATGGVAPHVARSYASGDPSAVHSGPRRRAALECTHGEPIRDHGAVGESHPLAAHRGIPPVARRVLVEVHRRRPGPRGDRPVGDHRA